jgi:hypothetical protein
MANALRLSSVDKMPKLLVRQDIGLISLIEFVNPRIDAELRQLMFGFVLNLRCGPKSV